jgi:hypothetical protein
MSSILNDTLVYEMPVLSGWLKLWNLLLPTARHSIIDYDLRAKGSTGIIGLKFYPTPGSGRGEVHMLMPKNTDRSLLPNYLR